MRQVRRKSVTPLWETNRWDGTLSGYCLYRGRPFLYDGFDTERGRKFLMHPVSDEDFAAANERHDDFVKWVGPHCDFGPGWEMKGRFVEKGTSPLFYEKYPAEGRPVPHNPQHFFYMDA